MRASVFVIAPVIVAALPIPLTWADSGDLMTPAPSASLTAGPIRLAQPGSAEPSTSDPSGPPPLQPAEAAGGAAPPASRTLRFGEEGSQWWTFGAAIAPDFDDAVDFNLHVGYTTFLVDSVEFTWENAVWYFDQDRDDAVGLSSSLVFRWHFLMRDRWSLYADAGIGGMVSTDDVPEDGTSVNLLPRLGVGGTWQYGDGPSRLQAGLRWHHISNARINSDDSNPSRDAPMLYVGLIVPF